MNTFARIGRRLIQEPGRTGLSTLAIAAAVVLIVVLEGFQVGLYRQIRDYPRSLGVPLVATQSGVANMTGARSIIPFAAAGEVRAVDGVRAVHPLVGVPLVYGSGDDKTPIYVVAYEGRGGPSSISRGRQIEQAREIVIDRGLARKYGLGPGDPFELSGVQFTIAGVAGSASNVFNPYVFVRLGDALALTTAMSKQLEHLSAGKVGVSFLLIETNSDADLDTVRASIEAHVASVDVLTPSELGDNDVIMAKQLLGGVLSLLVTVSYLIGILVIGLTLYASVFERLREFGVMKALGASNRHLYGEVFAEALLVVLASLAIGLITSVGVAQLIEWGAPQYLVVPWSGQVVTKTALAALLMGSVAALLPIRQVSRVDPAIVFKR